MSGQAERWRTELLEAIRTLPGASTRQLSRALGVSEWTTDYHLRRLLRAGAVTSETVGRTRCWYAAACGLCPVLRQAVPLLRRPEALALALAADEWPLPLPILARRAGVGTGTARWVSTVLSDAFVFERTRHGRVALRPGAGTCVSAGAAGARCGLWGKCLVSRAWERAAPAPGDRPRHLEERRSTGSSRS